jgi:nitrogenase molybdenum-iron protein alpha/beta subunit
MTGAASALAGFEGIGVIIHGPSGCYFYPATILHRTLYCSFLISDDIVCGTAGRLQDLVSSLSGRFEKIAIISTCIPSLIGEDVRDLPGRDDLIVVDSPGFVGDYETGYRNALAKLPVREDSGSKGINIDGISLMDPFYSGNIMEGQRILDRVGIPAATLFCHDHLRKLDTTSPFTLTTNPDLAAGNGLSLGCLLGLDGVRSACREIEEVFPLSDTSTILQETDTAEERIVHACDRYMRRYDPPAVAIFSGCGYGLFIADMLNRYLDAEILCIGSRNTLTPSGFPASQVTDLDQIRNLIQVGQPDLIFGSSFEYSLREGAAFIPVTPPVRGTVRLRSHSICGIEGALSCMEETLNACMDRERTLN